MIMLVEGLGLGAGKSFYVLYHSMAHFLRGGIVYAVDSFKFEWETLKGHVGERHGVVLEDRQLNVIGEDEVKRLHEVTPPGTDDCPVLIIVDEAHDELNARDHADKSKRDFFKWLTQSRHDNNDVIFISQHKDNVDGQIRRLADVIVKAENLQKRYIPIVGFLFSKYFRFHFEDRDGVEIRPPQYVKKESWLFSCYVSKSMKMRNKRLGEPLEAVKLKKVEKKELSMKAKIYVAAFVICLLAIGFCGWRAWRDWDSKIRVHSSAPVQSVPSPPSSSIKALQQLPTRPSGAFSISREVFRGGDGRMFLWTDRAQYEAGELSDLGFVVAIHNRVARLKTPDGQSLYIVAEDGAVSKPVQTLNSLDSPTPVPVKIGSAEWHPHHDEWQDKVSKEIDDELKRPLSQ